MVRVLLLLCNLRPFSVCGVNDAPTQPHKKPVWRPGTANMRGADKIGGGNTAAKPVVRCCTIVFIQLLCFAFLINVFCVCSELGNAFPDYSRCTPSQKHLGILGPRGNPSLQLSLLQK